MTHIICNFVYNRMYQDKTVIYISTCPAYNWYGKKYALQVLKFPINLHAKRLVRAMGLVKLWRPYVYKNSTYPFLELLLKACRLLLGSCDSSMHLRINAATSLCWYSSARSRAVRPSWSSVDRLALLAISHFTHSKCPLWEKILILFKHLCM